MKAAKSFLIVMGVYLTCWSPFCLILFIEVCTGEKLSKGTATLVCLWIGYMNSSLNPLIYTWKYKQFRDALLVVLKDFRNALIKEE